MNRRDAIVYLTRGSQLGLLERSVRLLCDNFLPHSPADVFVFHEDDADPVALRAATRRAGPAFCRVDFSSVPPGCEGLPRSQVGYRHMCRFFANEWFLRPELDGYRYVMRMDVDSFVLSPCRTNLFETMARNGFRYAYRAVLGDAPRFCTGLLECASAHFAAAGIAPKSPPWRDSRHPLIYYTNFEICDLAWFRGKPWQDYFGAIDAAGGIARHRWGDAPIRHLGVRALMDPAETWQAVPLHYEHWYRWRAGAKRRDVPWLLRCWALTAAAIARETAAGLRKKAGARNA